MAKNVFNIVINADASVSCSKDITFNKFESNVSFMNFEWPAEYSGYAYLLARSYTHRKEYFAIPVIDGSVAVGSTITQFDGPWAFNFAVMSDPIDNSNSDSIVFMSDVFKGLVYDNITSSDTPNATEPNVIRICNDVKYLYDMFEAQSAIEAEKRQQAIEKLDTDYQRDKAVLDGIAESVNSKTEEAADSAAAAAASENHAKESSDFAEMEAIAAMSYAKNAHSDMLATQEASEIAQESAKNAQKDAANALEAKSVVLENSEMVAAAREEVAENALLTKSYAVGGTDTRPNEDYDNARYYYAQTRSIAEGLDNAFVPMGTIKFELLSSMPKTVGFMYNISNEFTSTAEFEDGGGIEYPAGTNVYRTKGNKWDCLAGKPMVVDIRLDKSSYNPIANHAVKDAIDTVSDDARWQGGTIPINVSWNEGPWWEWEIHTFPSSFKNMSDKLNDAIKGILSLFKHFKNVAFTGKDEDVTFDNTDTDLEATNVHEAILEAANRVTDEEKENWNNKAEKSDISNPNLLDNSNFSVNSRGLTEYVGSGYTVDRWSNARSNVTILDNGINITWDGTGTDTSFYQTIEPAIHKQLLGKNATISAIINDELYHWTFVVNDAIQEHNFGDIMFRYMHNSSNRSDVQLHFTSTNVFNVKAIKLELGEISTLVLDSIPNHTEELLKCISSTADSTDTYANQKPYFAGTNPNLLDNSFYTINQRGNNDVTVIGATGFFADRWWARTDNTNASGKIKISGDGLELIPQGSTYLGLHQCLEEQISDELLGKTVTLSVYVTSNTLPGVLDVSLRDGASGGGIGTSLGDTAIPVGFTGIFTKIYTIPSTLTNGNLKILMRVHGVQSTGSIKIKAVKLEQGSISTLALDTAPNYAEELLKCQRYYMEFVPNYKIDNYLCFGEGVASSATEIFVNIPIPTTMRTKPSVSYRVGTYASCKFKVSPSNETNWNSTNAKEVTAIAMGRITNSVLTVKITSSELEVGKHYRFVLVMDNNHDAKFNISADL